MCEKLYPEELCGWRIRNRAAQQNVSNSGEDVVRNGGMSLVMNMVRFQASVNAAESKRVSLLRQNLLRVDWCCGILEGRERDGRLFFRLTVSATLYLSKLCCAGQASG